MTNEWDIFGARGMCRTDILSAFAAGFRKNLYILPCSVHELILVKDEGDMNAGDIRKVVREVNRNGAVMREEDILSDSVYYFDRWKREVRIAE